jgi:hypothetical protein
MTQDLLIRLADATTEAELRALLRRNPLSGDISLSLEREPNAFHAAGIGGDVHELLLGYYDDWQRLAGIGARFELDAYVNGEVKRIGYFGEFRMDGGLKQRKKLLFQCYDAMHHYHELGNVPYYVTTVVADNHAARRLFEADLPALPTYRPMEMLSTMTIPTRSGANVRVAGRNVRTARDDELGAIAALLERHGRGRQFQPVWSEEILSSPTRCRGLAAQDFVVCTDADEPVACLALWDQRAFKQTVVHGYAPRLRRLRPWFNLVAPILRQPRLPAPGSRLETTFLSHLGVAPDDADRLVAMVRAACRNALQRGLDYVMLAAAVRDPMYAAIQRHFSCHSFDSMLYLAYWEDGRTEAGCVDKRIARPEMAIL